MVNLMLISDDRLSTELHDCLADFDGIGFEEGPTLSVRGMVLEMVDHGKAQ